MQKLKNILGSRKKGAQEPHAAREHRYDSQGNAPSNLKGISLESLTLPADLTSYCTVPLFAPVTISIWSCRACATVCVCSALCLSAESSVLMQDESRSMGDAVIDMGSQSNPLQLQLIDEQVFIHYSTIFHISSHSNAAQSVLDTMLLLCRYSKMCATTVIKLKSFSFNRTHTSRAVRTQCRILRAPLWNLGLYSSSLHTW